MVVNDCETKSVKIAVVITVLSKLFQYLELTLL